MRIGINRIVKYSSIPPYNVIVQDAFTFNNNGIGRYVIEVINPLFDIITIREDILKGKLGCNPNMYIWVNKPSTINGVKKNHRKL